MYGICNVSYLPHARTLGTWNQRGLSVCAHFSFLSADTFLQKFVIQQFLLRVQFTGIQVQLRSYKQDFSA